MISEKIYAILILILLSATACAQDPGASGGYESAMQIELDSTVAGKVASSYQEDFYRFEVLTPGTLKVTLEEVPQNVILEAVVVDMYKAVVASATASQAGELIETPVTRPGPYYAMIRSRADGTLTETGYAFRVLLEPDTTMAPPPCQWAGAWETNWGRMVLEQVGDTVTGRYPHDEGRVYGTIRGNRFVGTWSESPSYNPPDDAGDMVLIMNPGCQSFEGEWRYGRTGSWDGDWSGTRAGRI